jgi:hypothetical protein
LCVLEKDNWKAEHLNVLEVETLDGLGQGIPPHIHPIQEHRDEYVSMSNGI